MPKFVRDRIGIPGSPGGYTGTADMASLQAELDATQADIAYLRYDPQAYGAVRGVVASGQRTTNTTAINSAAADARTNGGTLVMRGIYEVNGTIIAGCHVDARSCTIRQTVTTDISTFVAGVRSGDARERTMFLPEIIQAAKTGLGWTGMGVGLEIANILHSQIFVPRVKHFPVNMLCTDYGPGSVGNTIHLGILENGKVNLEIDPDDATNGWFNSNVFLGGRCSHDSGEGTAVVGTRHILIDSAVSPVNGNSFINIQVEADTAEFHLECFGEYNVFDMLRFEATSPKARFNGSFGRYNEIRHGYQLWKLAVTNVNGAHTNGRPEYIATAETLASDFKRRVFRGPTTSRPDASTGIHMFDTTINKAIWSDGSVYRDAMGVIV